MSSKPLIVILVTLLLMGGAASAQPMPAQTPAVGPTDQGLPATARPRRVTHPRIEINPRPLLYRRCAAWYVLQNRPSGTVLFPQQHCWWVRG